MALILERHQKLFSISPDLYLYSNSDLMPKSFNYDILKNLQNILNIHSFLTKNNSSNHLKMNLNTPMTSVA